MHINQAIKKFGKKASEAGFKEMKQLHDCEAFIPVDLDSLTEGEKEEIIDSLLLVEEKKTVK